MKALITLLFLCICLPSAFAAPLLCPQGSDASQEALPGRCPANDASFANNPAPNDRDAAGTNTSPFEITGPLFAPMNFQVLLNASPPADGQKTITPVGGVSAAAIPAPMSIDPPAPDPILASDPAASAAGLPVVVPATTAADPSPTPGGSATPAASPTGPVAAAAVPETGSIAMIGSGLVFFSLVAGSTRKRRRATADLKSTL